MLLRPKSKTQLKAEARFKEAVTNYLVGLGARPGHWYDFELDTPAELLNVTVYDDWVATRFDIVRLGSAFTKTCGHPCNPYSGKWNFHFGYRNAKLLAPAPVLAQLDRYFDLLMHWEDQSSRSQAG